MTEGVSEATPRTRPGGRTARVSEQVLDATVELIARHGVAAVTYEAVAKLSGAGRATLYRKWPQRDDLIRAALLRFAEMSVFAPDTHDIRADLVELLCGIGDTLATPVGRAIINASITAADDDPVRQLGQEVLQARLAVLQRRIDGAVASGQLPAMDVPFLNTMLAAPIYLSVMRDRRPLTRELAQRVVTTVLDGLIPR
ncbi:TetR/AcrR family transcriptional regulator [Dactylosporangium sp. CA-092794]|uniref:TetR/AcrR family transcriptional regulator n=1 Tax=Dactylosporangium sp. CA-092794 TaxID=3239929 RepID=UPI003D8CF268